MYSGWELSEESRAVLLKRFPPKNPDLIAHHITLKPGVKKGTLPPEPADIAVIGYAQGDGVEALVVRVDGSEYRKDRLVYHITWSIDLSAGRKPVDSNEVIQANGFIPVEEIPITTTPRIFD